MSKSQGKTYAKKIINQCKEKYGERRVDNALQRQVRITDLEQYLQKRMELK